MDLFVAEEEGASPFTTKNPLAKRFLARYQKALKWTEDYLEMKVSKRSWWTWNLEARLSFILSLFIPLNCCLAVHMQFKTIEEETEKIPVVATSVLKFIPAFFIFVFAMCLKPDYESCYSKKHFLDIGIGTAIWCVLGMTAVLGCFVLDILYPNIWSVLPTLCITGSTFWLIYLTLLYAQCATKLRFDPNSKYGRHVDIKDEKGTITRKDMATISILHSAVFKITLKNVGFEPWNSSGFEIHRHRTWKTWSRECFNFKLPNFNLLPGQEIHLIPETYSFEGQCIRIPGLHCFGTEHYRATIMKTFVAEGPHSLRWNKNEDGCEIQKNISELVIDYGSEKQEWKNVSTE